MAVMTSRRRITRVRSGTVAREGDELTVEAPLNLICDGESIATLMRTPGHDLELAAGWLVVESGVRRPDDLVELRACWQDGTDRVHVNLRPGVRAPRPRAFVTGAACGVCSADVIDLHPLATTAPHRP